MNKKNRRSQPRPVVYQQHSVRDGRATLTWYHSVDRFLPVWNSADDPDTDWFYVIKGSQFKLAGFDEAFAKENVLVTYPIESVEMATKLMVTSMELAVSLLSPNEDEE